MIDERPSSEEMSRSLFQVFHVGVSIQQLNRKIERRSGLSLVQWCLLKRLIHMPAVSAQALARTVVLHPSTLTQSLKRLEKRKLIFVTEDPKDSRKKVISITRTGKEILERTQADMRVVARELDAVLRDLDQVRNRLDSLSWELGPAPRRANPTSPA